VRLRFFGGLAVESGDGPAEVRGRGQEALLFRLALDAGTTVAYRALAEDVWPDDPPDDPRAALHSLASRLRRALPEAALEATPGGYRLSVGREDVDVTRFQDLVEAARREADPADAAALARRALDLWTAEPWLPEGFEWVARDLLEDRAHAERIARRAAPVALATGAGATTADVPAALTPLVGRSHELELIATQLAAERLVTLLGPGGAGKTTLAMETARREPGAVVVELAPVADGEVWNAIDGAIGRRLRVDDRSALPPTARERTLGALAGRDVLLVLDNCEHVVAETAQVVVEVLRAVPGARILATSREPLGVPGEAFVDLGPLPDADAAELLARRVRAARGAAPTAGEAGVVARIVRRLDGLPLAIELAAAKARTLALEEIEAGLDDRFALLRASARVGDARHQTLRALIDWSWDTLSDRERDALLAVAVFPDGVGAEDAAEIAGAFGVAPDDFDALVDRSLLRRGAGRFRMLETVREYGLDRLRSGGRLDEARRRQTSVMTTLALRHDADSRGPAVRTAVAWFDANEDNLTAATRWCASPTGDRRLGVEVARAQLWIWLMRERFDEIQSVLVAFGEAARELSTEADVVLGAVSLAVEAFQGQETGLSDEAARRLATRAEAVIAAARRHPSELSLAMPPILGGMVCALATRKGPRGPWSSGFRIDESGLEDAPAWTRALVAVMRAALAQNEGDTATLGEQSARALPMFLAIGDPWGIALASQMRSEWLVLQGRLEEALAVADAAAPGVEGLVSVWDVLQQRSQGVGILVRLGRVDEARSRLAELQELARADGSDRSAYQIAGSIATVEIAVGDGEAALHWIDLALRGQRASDAFPEQLVAWGHSRRAQALLLLGRVEEARDALRIAGPAAAHSGDQPVISDVAVSIAAWLAARGETERARAALAASDRLRGGRDETDPFIQRLRASLAGADEPPGPDPDPGDLDFDALVALLDSAP